ncbi:MAG: enoyl-CoA hydratase/isomerase family protein [Myxococcales bacterium]|nr:enoyl-CoA hydratase/isomerase family protein [Myxococcales bacterium]
MLRVERHLTTELILIDRPAQSHALSGALVLELVRVIEAAAMDEAVRVIVLGSTGQRVFVAGGDLRELAELPMDARGADGVLELGRLAAVVEQASVPVVAAVSGVALGGGAELMLACDLAVIDAGASVRFVHKNMGLVPAWGGTTRLIERVGSMRAAELLLTGRAVDAEEAVAIGLVSRSAPAGQATAAALAFAEELATSERAVLVRLKRSIRVSRDAARGAAIRAEAEVFKEAWGSTEHRAAFAARVR